MSTPIYTPLAFSGQSTGNGSLSPALLTTTLFSLAGTSSTSGAVVLTTSPVAGAFDDFALVPYLAPALADPALTNVTSIQVRDYGASTSSDPVNTWVRLSITASAPQDYAPGLAGQLYNRAAYARVGITSTSMQQGQSQQLAYAQMERTPPGPQIINEQFGSNLFSLEQSSYEGRMFYTPSTANSTYTRTTEQAVSGTYSGKFVYQTPPASNSYTQVQSFATYTNAEQKRSTYAALAYQPYLTGEGPLPAQGMGTGTALTEFTLVPMQQALARVQPGVTYQAQVWVATALAGLSVSCAVLRYDANYNLIGTRILGTASTSLGGQKWQRVTAVATMDTNAAWAAVVPVVDTTGQQAITFWVDQHRIWTPSYLAQTAPGTLPARPWQAPRQLTITVNATRLNYVRNPGFSSSVSGLSPVLPPGVSGTLTLATGGGVVDNAADFLLPTMPTASLTGSGAAPWTGMTSDASSTALISGLKPGTAYTVSLYVLPKQSPLPVTMWVSDGTTRVQGTSTPIQQPGSGTPWTRLSATITTAVTFGGALVLTVGYAAADVAALYTGIAPGTNAAVWSATTASPTRGAWSTTAAYSTGDVVSYTDGTNYTALVQHGAWANIGPLEFSIDQILAEAGTRVLDYFDGNNPSADYLWEGAVGNSRSHYYRGKSVNEYRLQQAISRQLALGGSYSVVYASPPV